MMTESSAELEEPSARYLTECSPVVYSSSMPHLVVKEWSPLWLSNLYAMLRRLRVASTIRPACALGASRFKSLSSAHSFPNGKCTPHVLVTESYRALCAAPGFAYGAVVPSAVRDPPAIVYGQVMSAQANYVRVRIRGMAEEEACASPTTAVSLPRGELLCIVRALLKKMKQRVMVGDYVRVVNIDWNDGRAMVDAVEGRRSQLWDPPVANIDHILLLFALTDPPFAPAQVSRFLVSAEAAGLPVTVALNKADLVTAEDVGMAVGMLKAWGYEATPLSVETGFGLDRAAEVLRGRTSVVAGPSGVGKSSLINTLRLHGLTEMLRKEAVEGSVAEGKAEHDAPAETSGAEGAQMDVDLQDSIYGVQAVGKVSQRFGKGKHTTRNVTLLQLPRGGFLADTPGFNLPSLDQVTGETLPECFPEIRRITAEASCSFGNCSHIHEPGCAVRESGEFQRWEDYVEMHEEVREREDRERRKLQMLKKRREGNVKHKVGYGGREQREVLLEAKKHRRLSRRRQRQDLLLAAGLHEDEDEGAGGPSRDRLE